MERKPDKAVLLEAPPRYESVYEIYWCGTSVERLRVADTRLTLFYLFDDAIQVSVNKHVMN